MAVEVDQPCGGHVEGVLLPAALAEQLVTLVTVGQSLQPAGQAGPLRVVGLEAGLLSCMGGGEVVVQLGEVALPLDVRAGQEGFEPSDVRAEHVGLVSVGFLTAGEVVAHDPVVIQVNPAAPCVPPTRAFGS